MKRFGTAVILAGGESTRMGFDKQLLRINNRKLIEEIINKLKYEFDEIIVVTNKPEYYISLNSKITRDIIVGKGPLSGIHVGLKEASSQMVFFVACDMPNVNLQYIRYMKQKIKNCNIDACVTEYGRWIEPFCAFYSKNIIPNIEKCLFEGKYSVNSLLKNLNVLYIEEKEARKFSPNWDMFFNLNTRYDLECFLKNIEKKY